jgi:hypothetical protein
MRETAEARWHRFLPLAGIAAVALWFGGVMTMNSVRPSLPADSEAILRHFQTNGETIGTAIYLFMLGSVLFLVFVAALHEWLKDAGGGRRRLTSVVFASGTIVAIGQLFTYGSDLDAILDASQISASTAEAFYFLGDFWFLGAQLAAAFMLIAVGLTRALPKWLGWLSIALGVVLLVPEAYLGMFLAFPVWVIITAFVVSRSRRGQAEEEATLA